MSLGNLLAKVQPMPSLRDSEGFIGRALQALARPANECHGSAVQEDGAIYLSPALCKKPDL
jgi:hypothetical protein